MKTALVRLVGICVIGITAIVQASNSPGHSVTITAKSTANSEYTVTSFYCGGPARGPLDDLAADLNALDSSFQAKVTGGSSGQATLTVIGSITDLSTQTSNSCNAGPKTFKKSGGPVQIDEITSVD